MCYGGYIMIYLYLLWFINQLITWGAPPCSIYSILDIKSTYTSHASNLLDYHIVYVHIQVDSLFYTYIYIDNSSISYQSLSHVITHIYIYHI